MSKMSVDKLTHVEKLLIEDITTFACDINLKECEKASVAVFGEWISPKSSIILTPETKEAILCTGIKHGTDQMWNDVWTYYKQSNVPTEKFLILKALACSTDVNVIKNYLALLTATRPPLDIRLQDYKHVFSFIVSHWWNTEIALTFVLENYKLFQTTAKVQILKSFFESLGENVIEEKDYTKLEEFYNNTKEYIGEDNIGMTLHSALVRIRNRIDWKDNLNTKGIVESLDLVMRDIDFVNTVEEVSTKGKVDYKNCSLNIIIMNRSSSSPVFHKDIYLLVVSVLIAFVNYY